MNPTMEAKDIMHRMYSDYAMEEILARSVNYIDGLKPVQRRILWAMYELGLLKDFNVTKKSARIVGDTMGKYHPHGDMSIYQAACAMATKYEGNNASWLKGQGTIGKKWSNPKLGGVHAAHMRYSELGFEPIAAELFGGIKENAVNFIPNFDGTEKEPETLPVSFPSVLVNMNKGIAVGLGSCMPSYTIENVCKAVAGIIDGSLDTDEKVAEALGDPDFPGECRIHTDAALRLKLYKTGKATFTCTCTCHASGSEIIIDSVPPMTTFETVMKQIKAYALTADGKDIVDVVSNIGKNTKGIRIKVKPRTNLQELLMRLYATTKLKDTVSFNAQIIWKGAPQQYSVKKIINCWLEYRDTCLTRMYKYSLEAKKETEHKLATWDAIKNDLPKVIDIIAHSAEPDAIVQLKNDYNLDDIQCEYLLDLKIRNICTDKAKKSLEKLAELRDEVAGLQKLIGDKKARLEIIRQDLLRIAKTYGTPRKSVTDGLLNVEFKRKPKREIPDTLSTVFITKKGFIKALDGAQSKSAVETAVNPDDEVMFGPIYAKKNEYVLIYTYSGICYKLLVDKIESSRGQFKQYLWELVDRKDNSNIFYATKSGDYSESFAIIYGSGRGRLVMTKDVAGPSLVYKNQFIPGVAEIGHQETLMLIPYKHFMLITSRNKAAMGTVELMKQFVTKSSSFKVTRITDKECLMRVLSADNYVEYVNKGYFDPTKYSKGYPVNYTQDPITWLDKPVADYEAARDAWYAEQERLKAEKEVAENAEN